MSTCNASNGGKSRARARTVAPKNHHRVVTRGPAEKRPPGPLLPLKRRRATAARVWAGSSGAPGGSSSGGGPAAARSTSGGSEGKGAAVQGAAARRAAPGWLRRLAAVSGSRRDQRQAAPLSRGGARVEQRRLQGGSSMGRPAAAAQHGRAAGRRVTAGGLLQRRRLGHWGSGVPGLGGGNRPDRRRQLSSKQLESGGTGGGPLTATAVAPRRNAHWNGVSSSSSRDLGKQRQGPNQQRGAPEQAAAAAPGSSGGVEGSGMCWDPGSGGGPSGRRAAAGRGPTAETRPPAAATAPPAAPAATARAAPTHPAAAAIRTTRPAPARTDRLRRRPRFALAARWAPRPCWVPGRPGWTRNPTHSAGPGRREDTPTTGRHRHVPVDRRTSRTPFPRSARPRSRARGGGTPLHLFPRWRPLGHAAGPAGIAARRRPSRRRSRSPSSPAGSRRPARSGSRRRSRARSRRFVSGTCFSMSQLKDLRDGGAAPLTGRPPTRRPRGRPPARRNRRGRPLPSRRRP